MDINCNLGSVKQGFIAYILIIMDPIVNFRCSPEDKELLVATACKHRMNLSDLIRFVLFGNLKRLDGDR
jgi:hypothetical protein